MGYSLIKLNRIDKLRALHRDVPGFFQYIIIKITCIFMAKNRLIFLPDF